MLPLRDMKLLVKPQSLERYHNGTEMEKWDQSKRIKDPEINARLHRNLGYDMLTPQIIEGKKRLLSNLCQDNWLSVWKKIKLEPYFTSNTK